MPPYDTTPTGYGQGYGTDPRDQITQALMNVRYPPPSMMPAQMQQFGMPQATPMAGVGQMPQAPMAGMGSGVPPAAQPQGGFGMQQPGMVAGAPQPALQPQGY